MEGRPMSQRKIAVFWLRWFLQDVLPVINRNEISGDRKDFKWLSIKDSFDFSTH
jgi:hypothetical protein